MKDSVFFYKIGFYERDYIRADKLCVVLYYKQVRAEYPYDGSHSGRERVGVGFDVVAFFKLAFERLAI